MGPSAVLVILVLAVLLFFYKILTYVSSDDSMISSEQYKEDMDDLKSQIRQLRKRVDELEKDDYDVKDLE